MTVKDLIALLSQVDPDLPCMLADCAPLVVYVAPDAVYFTDDPN
jgi:hypothetical protein